jgi:two-component system, OmpR family, sensor histidine kinase CiaH
MLFRRRNGLLEGAASGDARLLGRVRWRLVAWSGAITLAILVVLGGALYVSTASNLANATVAALQTRATTLRTALQRLSVPFAGADVYRTIGLAIGGPASGTIGTIVTPENVAWVPRDALAQDLPVEAGVDAVRASGGQDLRQLDLSGTSARVLSQAVDLPQGRFVIQVVAFRTAEEGTLRTLLLVLLVGGLGAVVLALAGGWLYAQRALVPIRDSLRRQREFAADASHELRTPLTILRGSVDDLRRHPDVPVGQVGTALEDMGIEVDHMTELVDGLLLLARADSGVMEIGHEPADLADAAAAALGELTPLAQERRVMLTLDAVPTEVVGDFGRLRQMAVILIDNAVRHSGGPAQVNVEVRREGTQALLRVDDTGRGIAQEDAEHVFDRFWRAADAAPGGLGLGLAIARWIAERHGGTIRASQRPGGGARLEVRLPVAS